MTTDGSGPYRIFGSELSPYSVKVRSYFRYKRIPHEWIVRDASRMEEFGRYARLPLIPLVVTPEGEGIQDSTPILERMEARIPEPRLDPEDPALAFLSALLEEYADEWGNKPMFHYRWWYAPDQESAARRIAATTQPDASEAEQGSLARMVRERMVARLAFVGSSAATRPSIEQSFRRQLDLLERHLDGRDFLFGGRPGLADFGLYAQLYQASTDPTPGALLRERAPRVLAWIERMLDPHATGGVEPWGRLEPTLGAFLEREVAGLFLPWSTANARALAAGERRFTVELEGEPFTQDTQKYHAKSLGILRERYARVPDRSRLDPVLERTGCLRWLV